MNDAWASLLPRSNECRGRCAGMRAVRSPQKSREAATNSGPSPDLHCGRSPRTVLPLGSYTWHLRLRLGELRNSDMGTGRTGACVRCFSAVIAGRLPPDLLPSFDWVIYELHVQERARRHSWRLNCKKAAVTFCMETTLMPRRRHRSVPLERCNGPDAFRGRHHTPELS